MNQRTRFTRGCVTVSIALIALFSANAFTQDKLTLTDGSIIEYYLALPDGDTSSGWPLAVFMGGGSGNKPISFGAYRLVGLELAQRGWAVVVPVSPDNSSFRGSNVAKVRALMADLQKRQDIKQGKILLGGISNGGISALEIARQNPDDYLGIMAVPAIVRDNANLEALSGMPVYLRIGGEDQLGWASQFDESVERLKEFGTVLDAEILDGAPHMFDMDWERLEPWLETVKQ